MVNSTRRFIFSLALCFVLVLFSPFSTAITSLGEKALVCVLFMRLFSCACLFLSFSASSWFQRVAATRDCGSPWTFRFIFLIFHVKRLLADDIHKMSSLNF